MTVWIVSAFDNLPTEGYRPQRYWLMAEAFARAGNRVVYWTGDFNHGTKERRKGVRDCGSPPEVVQIPTRPYPKNVCWARVRSHRRLARDFERLALSAPAPGLIVAATPPLGLCEAARRVARARGARFVCDIQDAWPETFGRLLPRGAKWLGGLLFAPLRRIARRLYREADAVTGVSARYAQLAGRDDYRLAYHGIDGGVPPPRERAPSAPPNRLVYIGNLGAGYDLETVIGALARRTDLSLDIAGRGPKEAALRARVTALRLGGRVRFHGYLGADGLRRLLASCDVGLVPMRDDTWVGLPYKLGDYLRAGLPVLSSLRGECGDLLARTGFGRCYAPGDSASFLAALDSLPRAAVSLPDELRADVIYPQYVGRVLAAAFTGSSAG